jgi:hypothetical protein
MSSARIPQIFCEPESLFFRATGMPARCVIDPIRNVSDSIAGSVYLIFALAELILCSDF